MRLARYTGTLTATALAALYLLWDPLSPDLAAQAYRAAIAGRYGFVIYDPLWYGGHHLPAYSLLSPPLFALLGLQATGAIAAILATFSFERLAHRHRPQGTTAIATVVFAFSFVATTLVSGRLTFAVGAALATAAAAAAERSIIAALPLAAAAGLASPVAGGFLTVALLVWALCGGGRRALLLAAAALTPAVLLTWLFGDGGDFPYVPSSLLPTLAVLTALALSLPRDARLLRRGTAAMVLLALAAGLVASPLGGNANRPGTLLAGTIAVLGLWPERRLRLLLLAPVLIVWQLYPTFADWRVTHHDAATRAAYYAPLRAELTRRGGGLPLRIEVPFTAGHWETVRLTDGGDGIMLARGWERQLDRARNPLFYGDGRLTAAAYQRWLVDNAVAYVALPDAPLDYSSRAEGALIGAGLPGLREVWRDGHWRLFAVRGARPLADGALVTAARPDRITLRAARRGPVVLRFSQSAFFDAVPHSAIGPQPGSRWIRICAAGPGPIVLRARLTWAAIGRRISAPGSVSCR